MKTWTIGLLFAVSMLVSGIGFASPADDFDKGRDAFRSKDYTKAVEWFNKSIGSLKVDSRGYTNTNIASNYAMRAQSYNNLKQYDQALTDVQEAIRLDPSYDYAYYVRACSYKNLADYEKALPDYDKYLVLTVDHYNDASVYYDKGYIEVQQRNYEAALADLKKAQKLDAGKISIYYQLGRAYLGLKQPQEAKAHFDYFLLRTEDKTSSWYKYAQQQSDRLSNAVE